MPEPESTITRLIWTVFGTLFITAATACFLIMAGKLVGVVLFGELPQ